MGHLREETEQSTYSIRIYSKLSLYLLVLAKNLVLYVVTGFDQNLSLDELHQTIFQGNGIENKTGEHFGFLKKLTFDREYYFIGARNRIYRLAVEDFALKQSEDFSRKVPWNCFPQQAHVLNGSNSKYGNTFTYDTCLSHYERAMAMNVTQAFSNGSKCYGDTYFKERKTPRNGRPLNGLIRFSEELEKFACDSCFIRGIEKVNVSGTDYLWVCGSFASFSKAFLLNPLDLTIHDNSYDTSIPSCARYPDEPMATHFANNNQLFVASGWGIYRPDSNKPDGPYNNSTMLYSDWRMLWNGLHWPTRMATLLGSDVRFIPRTYETKHYLYFFGSEVNPQYSYINSMTRQSYQSFMIRVCKNDTGANYTAKKDSEEIRKLRKIALKNMKSFWTEGVSVDTDETAFSYSPQGWGDTYQLPTKIFTSAIKFPFGCYLKRYDGAQSLNVFWGQQNIIYFNRLADLLLSFNWTQELKFYHDFSDAQKVYIEYYGSYLVQMFSNTYLNPNDHLYNSMVAAFSTSGLPSNYPNKSMGSQPSGAVCQFQVSEWKMDHLLKEREPSPSDVIFRMKRKQFEDLRKKWTKEMDPLETNFPKNVRQHMEWKEERTGKITELNQREEFLALYGSFKKSFFSRATVWNQGLNPPPSPGIDLMSMPRFNRTALSILKDASKCGTCLNETQLKFLENNVEEFEKLMNFSSMAWPTDWFSHITKYFDAFFHMNPMSVAGDNASFVMDNVEFAKIFVLKQNWTEYHFKQNEVAPLTYIILVSTIGDVYRVVMCDLVSIPIWKTECEMRNTDQPYVSTANQTMHFNVASEKKKSDKLPQVRVSSLLSTWRMMSDEDRSAWENMNPQSPLLKDAFFETSKQKLVLLTSKRVMRLSLTPEVICSSYTTCVSCASDPFCFWHFFIGNEGEAIPLLNGACYPVERRKESGFTKENTVVDVLRRGQQCEKFIPGVIHSTKFVCSGDMPSWSPEPLTVFNCTYKPLFRGFVKWQHNSTDIDFGADPKFIKGPNDELMVVQPNDGMSFQCVGMSFDKQSSITILARHVVRVLDEPEQCFCELWKNCADNLKHAAASECNNLRESYSYCPRTSSPQQSRRKRSTHEDVGERSGFAAILSHVSGLRTVFSSEKAKKDEE